MVHVDTGVSFRCPLVAQAMAEEEARCTKPSPPPMRSHGSSGTDKKTNANTTIADTGGSHHRDTKNTTQGMIPSETSALRAIGDAVRLKAAVVLRCEKVPPIDSSTTTSATSKPSSAPNDGEHVSQETTTTAGLYKDGDQHWKVTVKSVAIRPVRCFSTMTPRIAKRKRKKHGRKSGSSSTSMHTSATNCPGSDVWTPIYCDQYLSPLFDQAVYQCVRDVLGKEKQRKRAAWEAKRNESATGVGKETGPGLERAHMNEKGGKKRKGRGKNRALSRAMDSLGSGSSKSKEKPLLVTGMRQVIRGLRRGGMGLSLPYLRKNGRERKQEQKQRQEASSRKSSRNEEFSGNECDLFGKYVCAAAAAEPPALILPRNIPLGPPGSDAVRQRYGLVRSRPELSAVIIAANVDSSMVRGGLQDCLATIVDAARLAGVESRMERRKRRREERQRARGIASADASTSSLTTTDNHSNPMMQAYHTVTGQRQSTPCRAHVNDSEIDELQRSIDRASDMAACTVLKAWQERRHQLLDHAKNRDTAKQRREGEGVSGTSAAGGEKGTRQSQQQREKALPSLEINLPAVGIDPAVLFRLPKGAVSSTQNDAKRTNDKNDAHQEMNERWIELLEETVRQEDADDRDGDDDEDDMDSTVPVFFVTSRRRLSKTLQLKTSVGCCAGLSRLSFEGDREATKQLKALSSLSSTLRKRWKSDRRQLLRRLVCGQGDGVAIEETKAAAARAAAAAAAEAEAAAKAASSANMARLNKERKEKTKHEAMMRNACLEGAKDHNGRQYEHGNWYELPETTIAYSYSAPATSQTRNFIRDSKTTSSNDMSISSYHRANDMPFRKMNENTIISTSYSASCRKDSQGARGLNPTAREFKPTAAMSASLVIADADTMS